MVEVPAIQLILETIIIPISHILYIFLNLNCPASVDWSYYHLEANGQFYGADKFGHERRDSNRLGKFRGWNSFTVHCSRHQDHDFHPSLPGNMQIFEIYQRDFFIVKCMLIILRHYRSLYYPKCLPVHSLDADQRDHTENGRLVATVARAH